MMLGVYGAGFLARLKKEKLFDKVEAIYGASAGAMNAAYFLADQAELGTSIYFDDLIDNFISPSNILLGTMQRFWSRHVKELSRKIIRNAVNIDHAMNIVQNKKRLNIERVAEHNIKLFIELLNLNTGEVERIRLNKKNGYQLLRAAICLVPYYFGTTKINQQFYVDVAIKQTLDLQYLLKKIS